MTDIPEPAPVTLVTMTVIFYLDHFINLKLLSDCLVLDNEILGLKFESTVRGTGLKAPKRNSKKGTTPKDFKNQCTLIINVGDKNLNTKLFNTGKLVFTGCTDIKQITTATEIVVRKIHKLTGHICYQVPDTFKHYLTKDIFKKELAEFRDVMYYLAPKLGWVAFPAFNPSLNLADACAMFLAEFQHQPEQIRQFLTLHEFVKILRSYYPDEKVHQIEVVQPLIDQLIQYYQPASNRIIGVLPAYIGCQEAEPIATDFSGISIANINNRTACNFHLNREKVEEMLRKEEQIESVEFDEDRYSGVLAHFKCQDGKQTVIILFNSGKINITSATNQAQVDETYRFITDFCRRNYHEIATATATSTTHVTTMVTPNVVELGNYEGSEYVLLKKDFLLQNPRNVYLLKKFGLLELYAPTNTELSTTSGN